MTPFLLTDRQAYHSQRIMNIETLSMKIAVWPPALERGLWWTSYRLVSKITVKRQESPSRNKTEAMMHSPWPIDPVPGDYAVPDWIWGSPVSRRAFFWKFGILAFYLRQNRLFRLKLGIHAVPKVDPSLIDKFHRLHIHLPGVISWDRNYHK